MNKKAAATRTLEQVDSLPDQVNQHPASQPRNISSLKAEVGCLLTELVGLAVARGDDARADRYLRLKDMWNRGRR